MKILHLDIETAPMLAEVWGLFNQNLGLKQVRESGRMMCFAAMWDDMEEPYFLSEDSSYMITRLWQLLDEADVVVHYNGIKFDIPIINRHFLLAKLPPPTTFKQVDLLREVKKNFRFDSHKLDHVSQELGLGKKISHEGHELWTKCMLGDKSAKARMEEYNKKDVILTKDLFHRLTPWLKTLPNKVLYEKGSPSKKSCPICQGKVQKRGFYTTKVSRYQRYKCTICGANSRDRVNSVDRTNILVGI